MTLICKSTFNFVSDDKVVYLNCLFIVFIVDKYKQRIYNRNIAKKKKKRKKQTIEMNNDSTENWLSSIFNIIHY